MVWQVVLPSDAVPPGEVRTVEVDGREVVLWRSAAGALHAVDARCPHQWAHLGAVGAVDGEELVCLSHFWRFDGAGRGTKLAMNGRRDAKSDIECVAVRESEGGIEVDTGTV